MWPLKYPELLKTLDVKRPKGVLVHGPPGCGKTTLVRAMASMSGATFFSVSAASIYSPYVGDSEKSLAQVFHKARLAAPSVLFIDEIDGMVTNRDDDSGGSSSGVQERILSVLLNEMDGIGSTDQAERIGVSKFGTTICGAKILFNEIYKVTEIKIISNLMIWRENSNLRKTSNFL